jgi:hypothetical protein
MCVVSQSNTCFMFGYNCQLLAIQLDVASFTFNCILKVKVKVKVKVKIKEI